MEIKSLPVQNEDGDLVPGSSVAIYHLDSGDLATIYDREGGVIDNPIIAGDDGIIEFAAANGPYRAVLSIGVQQYQRFLYFSDIQEHNADANAHPALSAFITQEADRAEAAADVAALNSGVYPDTAAGLSATTEGDYFSVPSAEDDEYLILYLHDAGPVATEIKRYPSSASVTKVALNNRIATFPDSRAFESGAVQGAELADGTPVPELVHSLSDGEIAITSGGSATVSRYFWNGHYRLPGQAASIEASFEFDSVSTTTRPIISVGSGADTVQCTLTNTGILATQTSTNAAITSTAYGAAGLSYGAGELVTLRLVIDGDGDGYLLAISQAGVRAGIPVAGMPDGPIRVGWRTVETGEIKSLSVRYVDQVNFPAPGPLVQYSHSPNLLGDDWLEGLTLVSDLTRGWALNTGAGDVTETTVHGWPAVQMSGSRIIRRRVPVAGGQTVNYHLLVDAVPTFSSSWSEFTRLQIIELAGSSVVSTTTVSLSDTIPGEPVVGTIDLQESTTSVQFSIQSQGMLVISHPSLAVGNNLGFRPAQPITLAEVAELVALPAMPSAELIGYTLLPDGVPGRSPSGFTCTGLDKITRGKYAGCWIVGDDGRLVEGDGSPYVPFVHVLAPNFSAIVASFPLGYTGESTQGVAVDTSGADDTFWVATAGDGNVRHYDLAGSEITGDIISFAGDGYGTPNGLAYDPVNGALWVSTVSGGTAYLISCNPEDDPRLLDTATIGTTDMLHYDSDRGLLYFSNGENGTDGLIRVINLASGSDSIVYSNLQYAQAIEGIYIDRHRNELIVLSDGGYHITASPALNIALKYRISLL